MPKLTDTHLVILSNAAQRKDNAVLPMPKSLKITGAAVTRTLEFLCKNGFLEERPAARGAVPWLETEEGGRLMLVVTPAGLDSIGIVPEDSGQGATSPDPTPSMAADPALAESGAGKDTTTKGKEESAPAKPPARKTADRTANPRRGDPAGRRVSVKPQAGKLKGKHSGSKSPGRPGKANSKTPTPPTRPSVRAGTKQALLINLLKRKKGATLDDIVQATGWQAHSVRGAISGALKKKLGLPVTSEAVGKRGRVYRIADGR